MTKDKLLLVIPFHNTFIDSDLKILEEIFEVKTIVFGSNKIYTPLYLIKQFFQCLFYILSVKVIFVQFGGYHSFFPALFSKIANKKSFIVVHGTDAINFPEIGYGLLRKKLPRLFCYWSYNLCTKILPVSESLIFNENTYFDPEKPKKLGVLAEFPLIPKEKFEVIYNGIDSNKWQVDFSQKVPNTFLTVAAGNAMKSINKGTDLIIAVARKFPELKFTIVGLTEILEKKVDGNITYLPKCSQETLNTLYNSHQYYFQLSISEGFGLSLCEAMYCGCIPIVSNVNILPKIAGEYGVVLKKRSGKDLENIILDINHSKLSFKFEKVSNHIILEYSIKIRKQKLIKIVTA